MGNFLKYVNGKKEEDKKKSSSVDTATLRKNLIDNKQDFFTSASSKKAKEEEPKRTVGNFGKYVMEQNIGLDTFQSDLSSMGTTIGNIYSGWQSEETMKNTRSSIESMQKRINAYQEYQKIYGGADLSDLASGYQSILDSWDDKAKTYGKYKSADEYDNAMKLAKAELERRESMKTANLDEVQAEVDKLKGIQNSEYFKEVDKHTKRRNTSMSVSGRNGYVYDPSTSQVEKDYNTAVENLNRFLAENGYENQEALQKALDEKTNYLNQAKWMQKGISMASVADESSENYDKDFDKKSQYVSHFADIKNPTWKESFGYSDDKKVYDYINNVNGSREYAETASYDPSFLYDVGYEYMTEQEKKTYNYYYQEGGAERAEEYLHTIKEDLGARKAYADFEKYEGNTAKELLFSIRAGLDQFGTGMGSLFNGSDEYIPVNATQQLSGMIREDLDEVGFDNFLGLGSSLGQAVYDLGTTTANMAPSILASTVSNFLLPGSGAVIGGVTMGMSAAGGAYQEKINQGWDKDQARVYSTAIGISEGALQYALGGISSMGGKLSGKSIQAMATGIDNGLARFFATMGIKGASEGIEESLQEIITPFIENLALGYEKNNWSDVELAEVAYAGILGALSAGLLEGGGTAVTVYKENSASKGLGNTVRATEKSADAFNMASLTPQESDAYNLYTQYAKKGVNTENASDLQLGRLVYNTENASRDVLKSRKSSLVEDLNAKVALKQIENIKKDEGYKNRAKELSTETKDKKPLEEGVNIQGIKLGEDTKLVTENGEVSLDEVSLPERQAEIIARAEQMPENVANLFITQYDGETDVNKYTDAFNLAVEYSKNAFPQETILKNKGVLSERQVGEIYKATRIAVVEENQKAIDNITAKHSKGTFLKGTFDDSVVDYTNSTTDGSKVNWKDLTSRQRSAIKFAKMFSKATGANVRFIQSEVKDGKRVGKNGSYDPNTNTIEIDIYAGIDGQYVSDAIIPTLSHELTHWMKAKSPAIYERIKKELVPFIAEKKGMDIDGLVASEMNRIKASQSDIDVTPEYAMDELVSRACEDMLSNSNQARKLLAKMTLKEQQGFVEKVKETLNNLMEWANELLAHYKSESEEAKLLREYKAKLKKVSKMWDEMLVESIEANQALQKEGITGEKLANANADVQYEIRETEEGTKYVVLDKDIFLNDTGNELTPRQAYNSLVGQKIMLEDGDVITFVKRLPGKRDMYSELFKRFPAFKDEINIKAVNEAINKNIVETIETSRITKRNEEQRYEHLGVVDFDKREVYVTDETVVYNLRLSIANLIDGQKIAYAKSFVENAPDEIVAEIKKAETVRKTLLNQLFEVEQARKSATSTTKTIVPQNGSKSQAQNSDRDNLGNTLSEGQAEYFKDSKVRDENGNLLVMYRGDSSEFTVFDRKKSKYSNLYGRGFYFTSSKAHAEQYGNAREFYLDIKNPLIQKQNNITKKQMLNFLKAIENDGEDYDLYNYGQDATAESVLESVWGKGDYEMIQDINAGAIGDLVAAIELFNEVNGTNYDGIILPTETITFKSEQAKLTSNKTPTEHEDIRFSMRENVEETKELVAVHNMQVSELERTLDLGGLPMPSIAIIKAKSGHSEYGDVSLVFPKSTIDPKVSKLNKVYGGDAWTPTYPTIEYKPNAKVSKKINDKYYELSRKFGYDESRPLYNYVYDLEEQLNRNKGEAELLEGLYEDQNMMQLYLLDSGKSKVETIQKEIRTELTDAEVEMHEFFIKELGANVIDEIVWDGNGTPMSYRKNYLSKYEDAIRNAYKKLLTDEYRFTDEQVQNVLDSTKPSNLIQFMRDANKYRQNGRVTTRTEADYDATKQAIKDASADGYREWVDSLFKGIEEKSGIRNNTDYFTNSGNRRSWEALHWENNLENVVRVMKSQDNGVAALFSGHAIWAVSAKDYRTVEEIKADADRLQRLSEEEYSDIKQGFGRRFEEIAQSIMSKSESNPFIAADNAMSCIVEAVRNSKTKSGLLNNLREYSQLTVTESTVDDIISLVADISNMPTEYFEAKPRRAVELNEIATAIIPDNTSDATKTRLDDMGIKYIEYENGNEESRLNALNSLEELKFSDRMTESVYDKMGEAEQLRKDNERLTKDLGKLRERLSIEGKVTGGTAVLTKDTDLIAGRIRKLADSTYDKDALSNELKEFYTYMRESSLKGTWNEDAIFAKAKELAETVLSEAKPKTVSNDYAKFLLREIRSKRISLSETQVQEAKNAFGKDWRNAFWGKVTIANNGISLESQWQEWHSLYPEFFEADVNEGDQITALLELYDDLRDVSEVVQEYNAEEQTRWLAEEILDKCWELPVRFTIADKYDARIKVLKFEHRQAMKEMRKKVRKEVSKKVRKEVHEKVSEHYESRLESQKLELRWLAEKDKHEIRERKDAQFKEEVKEIRKKQAEMRKELRERKDAEISEAKKLGKERLDKYKENAERKTKIQSITAKALTLNKWLTKNSKDEHIHESMKAPVIELLQAIDFSSKQLLGMKGTVKEDRGTPTLKDISLSKALGKVKDMLTAASNTKGELVELYGHGLDEEIAKLAESVDDNMRIVGDNEFVLNKMTLEELNSLDKIVSTIKHAVTAINKFHTVNYSRSIASLSQDSMEYLNSLGMEKLYQGLRGNVKKLVNWGNAIPYYAFKRYGDGGKKIFEAFQNGWDKFAFHIKAIIDFTNSTYTSKDIKEWSKDIKEFSIQVPATDFDLQNPDYKPKYQKVQMTVPQIMSLYCLQKREQAKGHILGGGIRVSDFEAKKNEITSQPDGAILTSDDISTIIDTLTDKQREVADKLQEFMNTTCTDWGNEVSMLRFGYKAFGEENYFPIKSDNNNLEVDNEEVKNNSLFALLNMSFAKSTIEGANNRIIISDIFDVFAQHTSDMAKYNALALPVLDAFKWYNYTEKEPKGNGKFITTGVKQSMEKAFGKDGLGYFTTFLKDINGEKEVSRDTLGKHFFSSAKVASVAANLRVMLLQPTAYVRANALINPIYLTKALLHKPKIAMAEKHCGMALWKSMGYYDTNISKGVEEQIKHKETWKDKTTDFTLKGAEIADKLTWGYLWNACELEVRKTRKDLKVGSEEFYQTIGNRLREVIYATQVVDSTMTRSQMMRSGQIYDKMLTAFASEPTLAYNMLQDAYMDFKLDARRMGKKESIKKNSKKMLRVAMAYTMTNAVAALVESGFDAFRDDEDEEMDLVEFMKIYLSNFAFDMSITAKIPYIKEIVSILQGFTSSRTDTQWMQSFGYALKGIMKMAQGEGNPSSTGKHILRTASYLSGLPFYNAYRDSMALLDKAGIFTTEDLEEMLEDIFG